MVAELRERGFGRHVAMLTEVQADTDIVEMPFEENLRKPVDRNDLVGVIEGRITRSTADDQRQQVCSLAAKKPTLDLADAGATEEYEALAAGMRDLREQKGGTLDAPGAEGAVTTG